MSCIAIVDFAITSRYTNLIYNLSPDFYLSIYRNFSQNKYNSWTPMSIASEDICRTLLIFLSIKAHLSKITCNPLKAR